MLTLKGRESLVVGGGVSGIAAIKLLLREGSVVTLTDSNLNVASSRLKDLGLEVELVANDMIDFDRYELAVISPGVPWDSSLVSSLRRGSAETISELELASRFITAPIIAVTGTNGKSSTTTLIADMLSREYKDVFVGGNLGVALSDAAATDYDWVVAEVSSFQLEGIVSFAPTIAIILNISPDHLDRHKNMSEYIRLKKKIAMNMPNSALLVFNEADQVTKSAVEDLNMSKIGFTTECLVDKAPLGYIKDNIGYLNNGTKRVKLVSFKAKRNRFAGEFENGLAAAIVGYSIDLSIDTIETSINEFKGLPHRMEYVKTVNGVVFINDSKATNVGATLKSIDSIAENLTLICGGQSKGCDFSQLGNAISEKVNGAVLIGESSKLMAKSMSHVKKIIYADNMDDAIFKAYGLTSDGGTVLLSPASASFDMFRNYEDRGYKFCEAVVKLEERLSHAN